MKIESCKNGIATWIWSWNEKYQSETICNTLWNTINVNHSLGHIRLKFRSLQDYLASFWGSGAGMLTLRTWQRQKNPASTFKGGSTILEKCKPAKPWQWTKLQANPPATDTHAIKVQAPLSKFKHLRASSSLSISSIFFVWTILIQDMAHKINFKHFAMVLCRLFMVLMSIYLYEREHACV